MSPNSDAWMSIDAETLKTFSAQVTALLCSELANNASRPPMPPKMSQQEALSHIPPLDERKTHTFEELIDWIRDVVLPHNENLHHPRYFGWVFSPSNQIGALADWIVHSLNLVNNSLDANPLLAAVERVVIEYFGQKTGFGDKSSGLLVSGGTVANLTALAVARDRALSWGCEDSTPAHNRSLVAYASQESHFCLDRACALLGIGSDQLRRIPVQRNFQMDTDLLRRSIDNDLQSGMHPFCIIGTAGTTNTGTIDCLSTLADLAAEYSIWYHIDGAYGAFASWSDQHRHRFAGLEQADSLALDPHKWLYAPIDVGCLLIRDATMLHRTFQTNAEYLEGSDPQNPYELGLQLTRADRSLKVYLALQFYGIQAYVSSIERDIENANLLARLLVESGDFQIATQPMLSIVTFRYVPQRHTMVTDSGRVIDDINERICYELQNGGNALVSATRLDGKSWMRACVMNYHTTSGDIHDTVECISEVARRIMQQMQQRH